MSKFFANEHSYRVAPMIAMLVTGAAAFAYSNLALSAEVSCDNLPAAIKQQCNEVNRLIKEQLTAIESQRAKAQEEQRLLNASSARIIEQCRAARQSASDATLAELGQCRTQGSELQAKNNQLETEVTAAVAARKAAELERDTAKAAVAPEQNRPSAQGQGWSVPNSVKDCSKCPPVVQIAMGAQITLGAEHGRQQPATALDPATPLPDKEYFLQVREVSVAEFLEFLSDTGRRATFERTCLIQLDSGSEAREVVVTEPTVFAALAIVPQPDDVGDHPAVCITKDDAVDYAAWLSSKAGAGISYRLPSEIEWEYAARPRRGNAPLPPTEEYALCGLMNIADSSFAAKYQATPILRSMQISDRRSHFAFCNDTSALTEPVARRAAANPYGLINMLGNAAEFTASCWSVNGSADCSRAVVRGGSFASPASLVTLWARQSVSVARNGRPVGYFDVGFRLARDAKGRQ